jgi:RimJ/RimL family protein N-acetyltransferase
MSTTAGRVFATLSELTGRDVTGATTWAELDDLDSLGLLELASAVGDDLEVSLPAMRPSSPSQTIAEWLACVLLGGASPPAAVRLREMHSSDLEWVRHLTCRPSDAHRWRFRGEAPNLDVFVGALGSGVLVHHVVEAAHDGTIVGLVSAYGANLRDGVVSLAVLVADGFRGTFHVLAGVSMFVQLLFDGWPFRKIYIDVPAFNLDAHRDVIGKLFVCEGRLRDHAFHGGRHWDVAIYALTRERFAAASSLLVGSQRRGVRSLADAG